MSKCYWCDRRHPQITKDHVVPKCVGGTKEPGNIVLACEPCNLERSLIPNYKGMMARVIMLMKRRPWRVTEIRGMVEYIIRERDRTLDLQEKWRVIETERVGHSPTAKINLSPHKVLMAWADYQTGRSAA